MKNVSIEQSYYAVREFTRLSKVDASKLSFFVLRSGRNTYKTSRNSIILCANIDDVLTFTKL